VLLEELYTVGDLRGPWQDRNSKHQVCMVVAAGAGCAILPKSSINAVVSVMLKFSVDWILEAVSMEVVSGSSRGPGSVMKVRI
jgi:hypothetical protein